MQEKKQIFGGLYVNCIQSLPLQSGMFWGITEKMTQQ